MTDKPSAGEQRVRVTMNVLEFILSDLMVAFRLSFCSLAACVNLASSLRSSSTVFSRRGMLLPRRRCSQQIVSQGGDGHTQVFLLCTQRLYEAIIFLMGILLGFLFV